MKVRITIRSTVSSAEWATVGECEKEGDLTNGVDAAVKAFRSLFPVSTYGTDLRL